MDITDKTRTSTVGHRNYVFIPLLFAACCFGVFSGCSLPRVIVLKDSLTPEEHLTLGIAYEKRGELAPAIKEYKLAAKNCLRHIFTSVMSIFKRMKSMKQRNTTRRPSKKTPTMLMLTIILHGFTTRRKRISRRRKGLS